MFATRRFFPSTLRPFGLLDLAQRADFLKTAETRGLDVLPSECGTAEQVNTAVSQYEAGCAACLSADAARAVLGQVA